MAATASSPCRIIYEQKAMNGDWITIDHPFPTQAEAGAFCDDMNDASQGLRYRVLVIIDPTTIARLDEALERRMAAYQRFMAFLMED